MVDVPELGALLAHAGRQSIPAVPGSPAGFKPGDQRVIGSGRHGGWRQRDAWAETGLGIPEQDGVEAEPTQTRLAMEADTGQEVRFLRRGEGGLEAGDGDDTATLDHLPLQIVPVAMGIPYSIATETQKTPFPVDPAALQAQDGRGRRQRRLAPLIEEGQVGEAPEGQGRGIGKGLRLPGRKTVMPGPYLDPAIFRPPGAAQQ